MNIENVLQQIKALKYFNNIIDPNTRERLLRKCEVKDYIKNELIYYDSAGDRIIIFLSGKYEIRYFMSGEKTFVFSQSGEFWYGIAPVVENDIYLSKLEVEILFKEKTKILYFPLKELLNPNLAQNLELWIKVSKMLARRLNYAYSKSMKKVTLSNEGHFLKELINNQYIFKTSSLKELAYQLHINPRTLRRIVFNLEKKELIIRDKKKSYIKVRNIEKLDEYFKSLE